MAETQHPNFRTTSRLEEAMQLARAGNMADAANVLRNLLLDAPESVAARCVLAMILHESGKPDAAIAELDRAAVFAPNDVLTLETRAIVLVALARMIEAEKSARAALAINPRRSRAWESLGLALDAQGRGQETISAMGSALALQPDSAAARQVLVRRLLQANDSVAALEFARHPSVLEDVERTEEIAADFLRCGAQEQAIDLLKSLVLQHPQSYSSLILLARSLHQMTRSSEAMAWSDLAHRLRPEEIEPLEMRAVSLIDRGDVEDGLPGLRDLAKRPDAGPDTGNRHLILAHYDPHESNDALFDAHHLWVRRYVHPFGAPFVSANRNDSSQPLRIGWLSPRFGAGPVASFLTGVLEEFDRSQFRHVLVPLHDWNDEATRELRGLADEWLPMHGLDDAALLVTLRAANLDIAIDLAGHSFGNRLAVLAQRIAPLQICWLDYFSTTAIQAMDAWISDKWLTPGESSQHYTERLQFLPSGRFCYRPSQFAQAPDRIGDGPPVFVSFNRLAKLNNRVVDTWAEILRSVPKSLLELGAEVLGDSLARERTIERFAERGIPGERIRLHTTRTYSELLSAYRHVDIALDPFPFSGCTTTCDALWMGVPVVTLPGTTFVSRQSASLMWRMDRDAWVARDGVDYINRAVDLAVRVDELRRGRRDLRERTRTHLCDARMQAGEFGDLLQKLWRQYSEKGVGSNLPSESQVE